MSAVLHELQCSLVLSIVIGFQISPPSYQENHVHATPFSRAFKFCSTVSMRLSKIGVCTVLFTSKFITGDNDVSLEVLVFVGVRIEGLDVIASLTQEDVDLVLFRQDGRDLSVDLRQSEELFLPARLPRVSRALLRQVVLVDLLSVIGGEVIDSISELCEYSFVSHAPRTMSIPGKDLTYLLEN